MAYLMLIAEPVGQRAERTAEEGQFVYDRMLRFAAGLKERGVLVAAESLATAGVRVQKRDGRTSLIDGPFAEAKEMIGGYFLLDVDTRDEAVAIASDCPAAEWCAIEVRKLGPCFE
jgi:hypothetical protein